MKDNSGRPNNRTIQCNRPPHCYSLTSVGNWPLFVTTVTRNSEIPSVTDTSSSQRNWSTANYCCVDCVNRNGVWCQTCQPVATITRKNRCFFRRLTPLKGLSDDENFSLRKSLNFLHTRRTRRVIVSAIVLYLSLIHIWRCRRRG